MYIYIYIYIHIYTVLSDALIKIASTPDYKGVPVLKDTTRCDHSPPPFLKRWFQNMILRLIGLNCSHCVLLSFILIACIFSTKIIKTSGYNCQFQIQY